MIGIKDMAGLCQPRAAHALVKALKEEIGLPVHFHTHDTSGIAAASVLAAVDAGADAVDGAIDALSGLTSQPNLGSIVEALRFGPATAASIRKKCAAFRSYWEQVRHIYAAFESDIRAGASEVYVHGMPGGQYTNLREQARSLGIEEHRWPEVARAYAQVNEMFGDIIKVTPTSKVVGDLALMMVTAGLTRRSGTRPGGRNCVSGIGRAAVSRRPGPAVRRISASPAAQDSEGAKPLEVRPGRSLERRISSVSALRQRGAAAVKSATPSSPRISCIPRCSLDYAADRFRFGNVSTLPSAVFFYGLEPGEEISLDLERGKTLIVRFVAVSEIHDDGARTVFFELNGLPRSVRVPDRSQVAGKPAQRKIEPGNAAHVGAPMPGSVVTVAGPGWTESRTRRPAGDARSNEDGGRSARGSRWRWSPKCSHTPACRSTRRTCS